MSRRGNAELGAKLGEARDLIATQDRMLAVRNLVLADVDLTAGQKAAIATVEEGEVVTSFLSTRTEEQQ